MQRISFMPDRVHARLPRAEYERGWFFITLCTKGRRKIFGNKDGAGVHLNGLGRHAKEVWSRSASVYRGVKIDEFVVMPEHFHGIVALGADASTDVVNVVSQFKGLVAKAAPAMAGVEARAIWQRGYYDRYIREDGIMRVRAYIARHRSAGYTYGREGLRTVPACDATAAPCHPTRIVPAWPPPSRRGDPVGRPSPYGP